MLDIAVLSVATQNDDHLRLQNKTRQAHVHFQLQGSRELSYILHDNLRSRLLSPSRKVTPMAQPPRRVSRRRMEEWPAVEQMHDQRHQVPLNVPQRRCQPSPGVWGLALGEETSMPDIDRAWHLSLADRGIGTFAPCAHVR